MEITKELLEEMEQRFDSSRTNRVGMNAVVKNGILKSAENFQVSRAVPHDFSITLKQGEVTNQKKSGRCWMFAALNVMRYEVIHQWNLETFEFSQSYPLFYDKLEKSNYFLESILKTLDEPTSGRLISYLLQSPVGDGGQWDMFANLIRKYGVVPKEAMPESAVSSETKELVAILTEKLREDACILRTGHSHGLSMAELEKKKAAMMEEIYRLLCISLGKPPKAFDFECRDKEGTLIREKRITPQEFFAKYVGWNLDDYVSLINAPTADKPYYNSYTVKFLGNVIGGKPVRYLNLPIEELKKAAVAQMKDGNPVWFGCDVGKASNRDSGVMDPQLYDREALFDTTFSMNKAERLEYGQSLMTHAMVFLGVDLDEVGRTLRWRVENSWGKEAGKDGCYVMSDAWFDEYMYQVVVHKKYLSAEQLRQYESEPKELEPWDPMGSLAVCGY